MAKEPTGISLSSWDKPHRRITFPEVLPSVSSFEFGGEFLAVFFRALNSAMYVEFFCDRAMVGAATEIIKMRWRYNPESMHPDRYRGRGRSSPPFIDLYIKEDTFRFLHSMVSHTRLLDYGETKGAIFLYLYLGLCCSEGEFFKTHINIFGEVDYRTHENNYYVLTQILLEFIEDRMMDVTLWALQKEAQKMFIELFI